MRTPQTEDPTVLVVDDESALADLYTVWLEESYDPLTAYSGAEALEVVDESVDVVLLDRRMPDMSGDKVLEHLRERGFECPVAMSTAIDPDLDIVDLQIDEYVTKPLDRETINRIVGTLLIRTTYDRETRLHAALVTKNALLRSHVDASERESSEAYTELEERLAAMQADADVPAETLLRNNRSNSIIESH